MIDGDRNLRDTIGIIAGTEGLPRCFAWDRCALLSLSNSFLRFFVLGLFLVSASAGETQRFHLHDGDTVVFFGDSITNQRLYSVFIETYVLPRFPRMRVNFVHSGRSGDPVTGGTGGPIDLRLDRDVFAYGATVITVMLGMNAASPRSRVVEASPIPRRQSRLNRPVPCVSAPTFRRL